MPPAFSLQPVLNHRERRVETIELEFARLLATEQAYKIHLENLRDSQQDLFESLARAQVGLLDMALIYQMQLQLRATQKQIAETIQQIEAIQPIIVQKRNELVAAEQAKETLEKLKSNENEQWLAEVARRESSERDDQYIARAFRMAHQSS